MAWARAVSPSPLLADRLGCLLNLLGYAFLGVLILELSPGFHRGLVLIATCPLLILQAASLSADPLNVTLPFLALVGWWRLGFTEDRPRRLALAALGVLGLGLCLLKPTAAALLPCFALLPRRLLGGSSLGKAALLGAYLGLAAGVWYGWNHAALTIDVARWFDPSRPPIAVQRQAFASDPASFLPPFVRTLLHAAPRLGPQLLSYPGDWVPARVNALTAALSFVALAALVLGSPLGTKATGAWMTGLGLVAASSLTAIGLALWLAFGSPGMPEIPGLVGRYLYVPALALALLASALVGDRWARLRAGLFGCGLASNAVALTVLLHVILTRKP